MQKYLLVIALISLFVSSTLQQTLQEKEAIQSIADGMELDFEDDICNLGWVTCEEDHVVEV